ncbi:hypothetical protein AVEN_275637-1 [Araneus ventricosus]|uniref:Uncharacterized protein n=1 Tax=Araneus ventricosus TaxID=182803 RepID=A0A4Y2GNP9_ARAVE|nr:hypothetical protein AVEN_275637-1 [Araneus ventricosus]
MLEIPLVPIGHLVIIVRLNLWRSFSIVRAPPFLVGVSGPQNYFDDKRHSSERPSWVMEGNGIVFIGKLYRVRQRNQGFLSWEFICTPFHSICPKTSFFSIHSSRKMRPVIHGSSKVCFETRIKVAEFYPPTLSSSPTREISSFISTLDARSQCRQVL